MQYEAFNEQDMVSHFNPKEVTDWMKVRLQGGKGGGRRGGGIKGRCGVIVPSPPATRGSLSPCLRLTRPFCWLSQKFDPSRLVDTDSGGPANNLHVADVNDIHDCALRPVGDG